MCVRCAIPMTVWKPPWSRHSCRKNRTTRKSAKPTVGNPYAYGRFRQQLTFNAIAAVAGRASFSALPSIIWIFVVWQRPL
jgi:hypothetical protein